MKRSVILLAGILGFTQATLAVAADDGRGILEICNNGDPGERISAIAGGMAFGLLTGQGLGGPKRQFCPANSGRLTNGQYRQVICKYLGGHPEILMQDGFVAMGISLIKSYPCETGKE